MTVHHNICAVHITYWVLVRESQFSTINFAKVPKVGWSYVSSLISQDQHITTVEPMPRKLTTGWKEISRNLHPLTDNDTTHRLFGGPHWRHSKYASRSDFWLFKQPANSWYFSSCKVQHNLITDWSQNKQNYKQCVVIRCLQCCKSAVERYCVLVLWLKKLVVKFLIYMYLYEICKWNL